MASENGSTMVHTSSQARSPSGASRMPDSRRENRDRQSDRYTLLFTDLVGSTRLWETDPNRMEAALVRHDAILEQTISSYGGRVFKWTGDGCCAVFPLSGLAPQAAIGIRTAFLDGSWNARPALSLRIALHAGPLRRWRAHDFVGPTLNQAARLLEICAGNQILATTDVVRAADRCGGDTTWRLLGTRTLRDIRSPVEVVEVGPAVAAVQALPAGRQVVDVSPNQIGLPAANL